MTPAEIVASEAMKRAFDELSAFYTAEAMRTRPEQQRERDMAHLHHTVLQHVRGHLASMAQGRQMTKEQIAETVGKRARFFV